MTSCFALFNLNPIEIVFIVGLGLLLFGRKLPDVGRYLGRSMIEFKKGMKGLEDDVESTGNLNNPMNNPVPMEQPRPPQRVMNAPPRFEDNPGNITNQPKM
jgi:sec-independent protein translocase protein TatA